jgi:hypothetical protein
MLASFLIEIVLAMFVLVRYRASRLTALAGALLLNLAVFQWAEYAVCGGQLAAMTWASIGYMSITLLPPLGVHLVYAISGRRPGHLVALAYASSALWIGLFAFSGDAFLGYECRTNYVMFQLKPPLGTMLFVYYYTWLLITLYLLLNFSQKASVRVRRALKAQFWSYGAFMLPAGIINLVWPQTAAGLPSIMCGFAVIFAITLVFIIMPIEKVRTAGVLFDKHS